MDLIVSVTVAGGTKKYLQPISIPTMESLGGDFLLLVEWLVMADCGL